MNANYRYTIRFDSAITKKLTTLTCGQLKMTKDLTLKDIIFTDTQVTTGIGNNSQGDIKSEKVDVSVATLNVENSHTNQVADRGTPIYFGYPTQGTVVKSRFEDIDSIPANCSGRTRVIFAQQQNKHFQVLC